MRAATAEIVKAETGTVETETVETATAGTGTVEIAPAGIATVVDRGHGTIDRTRKRGRSRAPPREQAQT